MTVATLGATLEGARVGIAKDVEAAHREVASIEARMRGIEGLAADPLDEASRVLSRTMHGAKRRMLRARDLSGITARRVARTPHLAIGAAFAAGVVATAMVGWVSRRSAALAATASTLAEFGDEPDEPVSPRS